jgi:hypothetical protein
MSFKFSTWDELNKHCIEETGCKPYSGAGICNRKEAQISILRSVDDTYYYDDNLDDMEHPQYTLFGSKGDQKLDSHFNKTLLDRNLTKCVYLYRVIKENKKKIWWWYGKYTIESYKEKKHIDKDNQDRIIYILQLTRNNS